MQAHQPLHQREPDAKAAVRGLSACALLKELECRLKQLGVHADARCPSLLPRLRRRRGSR